MHITKRGWAAAAAPVAVIAALGLSQPAAAQEDLPEITITVSELAAATPSSEAAWQAYQDYVSEQSGGKITFELYWGSALMAATEMGRGIGSGLADAGTILTVYTPADFPITNWVAGLASIPKGGVPYSNAYGTLAITELVRTTPEIIAEFADLGLHVVGDSHNSAFDLFCKGTPVSTLEEARGTRVRVGGQLWAAEVEALGMNPVPIVYPEIYEGFSRGIIDCVTLHPTGNTSLGLVGVPGEKYWVPLEFAGWNAVYFTINKELWDSLPADYQRILTEGYAYYFPHTLQGFIDDHATWARLIREEGINVLNPSPELVTALTEFQTSYREDMIANPPEGLADPQALVTRFEELNEKWAARMLEAGFEPTPTEIEARLDSYLKEWDFEPFREAFLEVLTMSPDM